MRENSGSGKDGSDSRDPTLDENAERKKARTDGGYTDGQPFEVAADRDPVEGKRSPSARGRGETGTTDEDTPNIS